MKSMPDCHAAFGGAPADQEAIESSSPQVVNLEELLDRCMGNLDLAERALQKFQETFPQELEQLESALQIGDVKQLACVAHRIKGISANISAAGVLQAAAKLEELCSAGCMRDVSEQIDRLRCEWARCLVWPPLPLQG